MSTANIQAAHDFLVSAFGLTAAGVNRDGDCAAAHGEGRAGDDAIELHHVNELNARSSPAALAAVIRLVDAGLRSNSARRIAWSAGA